MFAFLNYLSLSAQIIKYNNIDAPDAAFDMFYKGDSTAYITKQGFYAIFQYYQKNGTLSPIYRFTSQQTSIPAENGNIKVQQYITKDNFNPNLQIVSYQILNNDQQNPLKYKLGVFTALTQNDNVKVSWALNKHAIAAQGNKANHMVIIKGTDYPDVDTVFFGEKNIDSLDKDSYPYFDNTTTDTTSAQNSAYAFSWQRTIQAFGSEYVGFIIGPNEKINRKPIVRDLTPERDVYPKTFTLSIEAIDYDEDVITMHYKIDGEEFVDSSGAWPTDGNEEVSHVFYWPVDFKDKTYLTYEAWAVDKAGTMSTSVSRFVYREGYKRPELHMDIHPLPEYTVGDYIEIAGYIEDEKGVYINWKFNQGAPERYQQFLDTTPEGQQYFKFKIPIPALDTSAESHTIYIWASDPLEVTSQKVPYTFKLKAPTSPTIMNSFISDERVLPQDKIVIYGVVSDPDDGQLVNILVRWEDTSAPAVTIGNVTVKNNQAIFSLFYDVPAGVAPGRYHLYVSAVDADNKESRESFKVGITVYDPVPPEPQKLSRIYDPGKTRGLDPNACFTLHYTQHDGSGRRSLTANDEGFYVAYRLYQENQYYPRAGFSLINSTHTSTTDDITINYFSDTDPVSGFFQAKFNITNTGYFDQRIDLGLFVDSNFGQSDQRIERRDDGRGFVVSDPELNVFYTVFTRYGDYPDVSYININPNVKRPASGLIPVDQMPFFQYSDDPFSTASDPMYGLFWKRLTAKAGTSIIYALTFAGHDNLRTPSRIQKSLKPFHVYYSKNDLINLTLKVYDDNVAEKLDWTLVMTGQENRTGSFTVKKDDVPEILEFKNIDVGQGPFFEYKLIVTDQSVFFPAVYNGKIIVSKPPTFTISNKAFEDYVQGERVTLSGWATAPKFVDIKYSFSNGVSDSKPLSVTGFNTDGYETKWSGTMRIEPALVPREEQYTLRIWAEDENGIKSENTEIIRFKVIENIPPVLKKAGISKKVAMRGEKLLSYAVINDTQIGRNVQIYVVIGDISKIAHTALNQYGTFNQPVAFYVTIPNELEPGTYDVTFRAKDVKLWSENNITKTIIVT